MANFDSWVSDNLIRAGSLAGFSLLLGLFVVYGLADFNIGYPALRTLIGSASLLFSCLVTLLLLSGKYYFLPMTFWGSGLAVLLSVSPLYLALKSQTFVCHLTTAKWVILMMGFLGACLLLFGIVKRLETIKPDQASAGQAKSTEGWSIAELKCLALLVMFFLALFLLWQALVANCWW